mmetsp:Transcript_19940/g.29143  ORF Transcript_19940/g.29143 Transcript_19940/m.29143 type:complete len:200 (+) Transcript_19940:194-793(+)
MPIFSVPSPKSLLTCLCIHPSIQLSILKQSIQTNQSLTSARSVGFIKVRRRSRKLNINQIRPSRRGNRRPIRHLGRIDASRKGSRKLPKETLDIIPRFRTTLHKQQSTLLRLLLPLLRTNLSLIIPQISLIPHQADDNIIATLVSHVFDPLCRIEEGGTVGDIVHDHGHARITDIRRYERAEALLPSSVPQLEANRPVL